MIKLYRIVENINKNKIMNDIYSFLDTLDTDDVGKVQFDDYIVHFEGFTDECWYDANKRKKSISDLENEMIEDWTERLNNKYKLVDSGWHGDIFYAIFLKK